MLTNLGNEAARRSPQPGELWLLRDSATNSSFLLIVKNSDDLSLRLVSGMLFSDRIEYMSNINVLVTPEISGSQQPLLALTNLVQWVPVDYLKEPVGQRLSRSVYDLLLSIGDYHCGLLPALPTVSVVLEAGLSMKPAGYDGNLAELQAFQQQTTDYLESIALSPRQLQQTIQLLEQAILAERDLAVTLPMPTKLYDWLRQIFAPEWLVGQSHYQPALALRSESATIDPALLIEQLENSSDEQQSCQLLEQIGQVRSERSLAADRLAQVINSTVSDEMLWTAVHSLTQLNPVHPALGVSRVKLVKLMDLGDSGDNQILALGVTVVRKADKRMGVMVQLNHQDPAQDLPEGLRLKLLDNVSQVLRTLTVQPGDYGLQLKLSGVSNETFQIAVEWGSVTITENFVL